MGQTYSQSISQLLSQELSGELSNYSQTTLKSLEFKIKNYLKHLDSWNKQMSITYNNQIWSDPNLKEEYKRYVATKQMLKIMPDIENYLKQGYLIIDIIREKITQEKIQYYIGVEYRGQLYEGYMTLENIMEMAHVTPQWKGTLDSAIKLRLTGTNKSKLLEKLALTQHSTLYSTIRQYASSSKKTNKGNVYETYRAMLSRHRSNEIPPAQFDPNEFDALYLETRKNTGSFVTGGDILNDQVKFFGDSIPSLASISTIKNTLTTFLDNLSNYSGERLNQEMNKLFNNTNNEQEIKQIIENESEKVIEQDIIPLLNN